MKRRSKKQKAMQKFDRKVVTRRWLRSVIMQAVRFWSSVLRLNDFVNVITIYISDQGAEDINGDQSGACVVIDHTRRTANIRIKRGVVSLMANEYQDVKLPEEIVEMTVLHELNHILLNPISDWVFNTVRTMPDRKILDNLFEQEEEAVVEHLTRIWFYAYRDQKRNKRNFKGKIIYLSKDPDIDESPTPKEHKQ